MSKKCTPLWREGHFQVKMYKTPQRRTAFGSCDVEKVHAVVARNTFRSQNVQNTSASDRFWKLRCRKSARRCGAKHISKSKCTKHTMDHFWRWDVVSRGRRKGFCTCSKVSKTWGFCSISKNDGRHGTFEDDLQRCIFRGRRSTKDMFMRDVRWLGRWFPERGCILEYQMCRFAKMILRAIFRGRRSTLNRWTGKIAKRIGTRLAALHSTFHFWRKSRRILFLMSWTSKNEEVSQNCFVSDVVKLKKSRRLAELFRFGRCYVQTWRKSHRISSFLILQIDR